MCGIAGILSPRDQLVTDQQIQAMGKSQLHRGPDNFGTLLYGNCGFAHTRLSIMDLSDAGNQPISDGRYVLIYNGEIYNYLSLREILHERGVKFKSTSDTEVLFYYLIHFGVPETLKAIRGMFAFSFYDTEEQTVYLCRDRLGIKPLFWTYENGRLYWSSEVKALLAVTSVEPDPVKTLFATASVGDHSNYYTVFKNVSHVSPGAYLVANPGTPPQQHFYYTILDDIDENYYRELDRLDKAEVQARFETILNNSIKSMLMSDAPMGAFVSGGIDSSLIALKAVQHDQALTLFTANVVGRHSEVEDARRLSQSVNRQLYEAAFQPEMMLTYWAESTYHYEVPIVTHTNSIPFAQVAKLAHAQRVKAVLTGEGSDELFLGYPRLLTRRYNKIVRMPADLVQSAYGLVPQLKAYLFATESNASDFIELMIQDFERQRLREEGYRAYGFLPPKAVSEQYLTIQMVRESLLALLLRNDRMGMLAGIESRFPYLDEEMIRFAVNLPVRFKIGRSTRFHDYKHPFLIDKAIVRRTALKYLPESLVYKRKEGFPMYGHKNVQVKPGFFKGGYVQSIAGITSDAEHYMIANYPYLTAKLASVEVFGRIFAFKESLETITEHLHQYITLQGI